jgi:hypothetical protein
MLKFLSNYPTKAIKTSSILFAQLQSNKLLETLHSKPRVDGKFPKFYAMIRFFPFFIQPTAASSKEKKKKVLVIIFLSASKKKSRLAKASSDATFEGSPSKKKIISEIDLSRVHIGGTRFITYTRIREKKKK